MARTYYRYVTTWNAPTVPAWSNVWPGSGGCSNRTLSLTATDITDPPAPGSPLTVGQDDYVIPASGRRYSGMNRGGVPPYRMTDYSIGRKTYEECLVKKHWATTPVNVFYQFGNVPYVAGNCVPTESHRLQTGPLYSTYDEQFRAYDYWPYPTYTRSEMSTGLVQAELDSLRNELLAEASTSYDALTDIAQIRDIPRTLAQIAGDLAKILGSLKSRFGRDVLRRAKSISPHDLLKHPDRLLKTFGGEWMNYRYGIMPLVYSYRDIMKLMKRGQEVRTYRQRTITPTNTGQSMPSASSIWKVKDCTGSIQLRGEVFQWFSSAEIARLSSVGMNPIVTAWELIPYSFVLDWFIDVGSYIAAATCSNWAQTKYACLSKREKYTTTTKVNLPVANQTLTVVNKLPTNWWGAAPPATPNVVIKNDAGEYLIFTEIVDMYSRWNISVSPVVPVFNPSLNWRRLIDGAVLSLNQLGRLFRRL